MKSRVTFSIVAAAALLLFSPSLSFAHSKQDLRDEMRELWIDHAAWTRLYIVSAAAGLPDVSFTAQRLLRNQEDIGNAIAVFYGREAGDQLTFLLKDHILIAAELVEAAKVGDSAKVSETLQRWYLNADDISMFLHAANPKYWPLEPLKVMMRGHLDQTLAEASHRLQGNYSADIRDYDEIVHHLIMMADMLSDGIVKQFPQKFNHSGGKL